MRCHHNFAVSGNLLTGFARQGGRGVAGGDQGVRGPGRLLYDGARLGRLREPCAARDDVVRG